MRNDNQPGGRDLIGHSAVQAWSAGPLFPAVIAVIESYDGPLPYDDYSNLIGIRPHIEVAQYEQYVENFYAQSLDQRLHYRAYELIYPGRKTEVYATREDAERAAAYLKSTDKLERTHLAGSRVGKTYTADAWPLDPGYAAWDALRAKAGV